MTPNKAAKVIRELASQIEAKLKADEVTEELELYCHIDVCHLPLIALYLEKANKATTKRAAQDWLKQVCSTIQSLDIQFLSVKALGIEPEIPDNIWGYLLTLGPQGY